MTKVWILTSEYNEYDQHGEYFEHIWFHKPSLKELSSVCGFTEQRTQCIIDTGTTYKKYDQMWYNLKEYSGD